MADLGGWVEWMIVYVNCMFFALGVLFLFVLLRVKSTRFCFE